MAQFTVKSKNASSAIDVENDIARELGILKSDIYSISNSLGFKIAAGYNLRNRLNVAIDKVDTHRRCISDMSSALQEILNIYESTENELLGMENTVSGTDFVLQGENTHETFPRMMDESKLLQLLQLFFKILFPGVPNDSNNYEIDSIVFDDEGAYGGDQGSPKKNIYYGEKYIYDIVRKYYPNYSDNEIEAFLIKLNSEGCGYVAVINTIFASYEGREDDFEKTFGFPMYGKDGDLNYDYLLVDFYATTDNHNRRKFLWLEWDKYNSKEDSTIIKGRGTSQEDREYRTHLYLDQKGVQVEIENNKDVTISNFKELSEDGYVIVSYHDGNLYNEDGSVAQYIDGGHAMTVTGVTSDGRYIVSSWGGQYYINPSEGNSTFAYYQYNQ